MLVKNGQDRKAQAASVKGRDSVLFRLNSGVEECVSQLTEFVGD